MVSVFHCNLILAALSTLCLVVVLSGLTKTPEYGKDQSKISWHSAKRQALQPQAQPALPRQLVTTTSQGTSVTGAYVYSCSSCESGCCCGRSCCGAALCSAVGVAAQAAITGALCTGCTSLCCCANDCCASAHCGLDTDVPPGQPFVYDPGRSPNVYAPQQGSFGGPHEQTSVIGRYYNRYPPGNVRRTQPSFKPEFMPYNNFDSAYPFQRRPSYPPNRYSGFPSPALSAYGFGSPYQNPYYNYQYDMLGRMLSQIPYYGRGYFKSK